MIALLIAKSVPRNGYKTITRLFPLCNEGDIGGVKEASQTHRVRSVDTPNDAELLPAGLLRRVIALTIDWALCSVIAFAFWGYDWHGGGGQGFKPLVIFAVQHFFLVSTLGSTVGQRICQMRVIRADGAVTASGELLPVGFRAGFSRTLLLVLVLPAVLADSSGRHYHDIVAGTNIIRL